MRKTVLVMLATALVPFCAFAVDGVVLINQSTVTAAGGFPYTISVAGSYKLSGNLMVPSLVDGIKIEASNVTLDLNGFSITTVPGTPSSSVVYLIDVVFPLTGVTVRNGTLGSISLGFHSPIYMQFTSGTVAEDLTLLTSGQSLAHLGSSAIVRRVLFVSKLGILGAAGIFVTCPALVVDSLASDFNRNTASSTACTFGHVSGPVF